MQEVANALRNEATTKGHARYRCSSIEETDSLLAALNEYDDLRVRNTGYSVYVYEKAFKTQPQGEER